jgi:hypothetical protein
MSDTKIVVRKVINRLHQYAWKAKPPKDLLNRDALERELAREIGKVQARQVGKMLELMGDPPNMANVPATFWDEAGEELRRVLSRFLNRVYLQRASQLMERTTIGVDWALINERAATWASRYSFDLVGGIDKTSRELLQGSINRYFRDGLTREELEAGLRGAFGEVRAEMIAVTEITRAASAGEHELADQIMQDNQSIEMVAIWQTNEDELVCEICGPNNDKERGKGWQDDPPAHPRCRCWLNHDMRIRTEKALKYSDDQPRDEAGRWSSGGGGSYNSGSSSSSVSALRENWEGSLSESEKQTLHEWGISGRDIRDFQSGNTDGWSDDKLNRVRSKSDEFAGLLDKGVRYEGTISRGLSNVPYENGIENWIENGEIILNNDQSATSKNIYAKDFAVDGWGDNNAVVLVADQKTGVALFDKTNVTMGGKSISESEVVMRKGTTYKVKSATYYDRKGNVFPPSDYFEGTDFSWPSNPPPNWYPGSDISGHWEIHLEEK